MDDPWAKFVTHLVEAGVWPDPETPAAVEQQSAISSGAYPLTQPVFDDVRFRADGEDLAEGQVEDLLREMSPALGQHGVRLDVDTVEFTADRYEVTINGRSCLVWGPPHPWDWLHATVRPLAIVNDLLTEVGAAVRVHTLAAGTNDGDAEYEARLEAAYAAGAPREYSGPIHIEDVTARVVYAGFFVGLDHVAASPDGKVSDAVAHFLGCDDDPQPDRSQLVAVFAHARKTAADVVRRGEGLGLWLAHGTRNPGAQANAAVLAALECAADLVELAEFIVARFPDRYDMENFMRYCPYDLSR